MKARNKTAPLAVHAVAGGLLSGTLSLTIVLTLCSVALAQIDVNLPAKRPAPAGPAETAAPTPAPVTAEVTGNNVYIRSGPATNFYQCGKLNKGDRVQVVKTSDGWTAIVPPQGSYSWVAVQYVSVSVQNPSEGIVTGNGVPVYAGSDELEPLVSTTKQDVTLSRGEKVRLLGEEKEDYYKIAPPPGAYLWVSSQYLQAAPGQGPNVTLPSTVKGGAPQGQTPVATTPTEAGLIAEYYALSKQVAEEQKKPLDQQNYTAIREKLQAIANNKDGGRASRYAQYTLRQIDRIDLARTATQEVALQNQEIKDSSDRIDAELQAKLKLIGDPAKYVIKGKLQPSALYATVVGQPARYMLVDDAGGILCYAAAAGAAIGQDLTPLVGHKVGLVGQVLAQKATGKPFVEFSGIDRLD